jgi:hypothetical protein
MAESMIASREKLRSSPGAVVALLFGLFMLGLMVGMLLESGKAIREWYEWGSLFFIAVMLWRLSVPIVHEF